MNEEKAEAGAEVQPAVTLKKEIVPFEQEGPVEEPLFVNHCQVAFHAGTVYIDVGVLPLDEVAVSAPPSQLRFIVLNRLVMSGYTLMNLKLQVDELIKRMGEADAKGSVSPGPFSWGPAPGAPEKSP